MSFSGANGGATPGAEKPRKSSAFGSGGIPPLIDHCIPTGHDQWKLRGPKINPHAEAEDRQAVSG